MAQGCRLGMAVFVSAIRAWIFGFARGAAVVNSDKERGWNFFLGDQLIGDFVQLAGIEHRAAVGEIENGITMTAMPRCVVSGRQPHADRACI